jgi:hypothetical protein
MFATATGILPTGADGTIVTGFVSQITPDLPILLGLLAAVVAIGFVWRHFKGFAKHIGR